MLSGDFIGSTRFEVRRRIGSGAFGVVYEAFDSARNATIAIKALRHDSADALLRFKREFRSLTDITHRNLVQLYELIAEGRGGSEATGEGRLSRSVQFTPVGFGSGSA